MAIEIERKFLVTDTAFLEAHPPQRIVQGYLANTGLSAIRVRISGDAAWLTIKSRGKGISRQEYEYPVPLGDAERMLASLCEKPPVEKHRYKVPVGAHTWDVDVFEGANAGLIVAEVELGAEDEVFERPGWLGEEVSDDPRYLNSNLAEHPFEDWV